MSEVAEEIKQTRAEEDSFITEIVPASNGGDEGTLEGVQIGDTLEGEEDQYSSESDEGVSDVL
jgi:hypothetical protein